MLKNIKRFWIVIIGFCIAFGFVINCVLYPLFVGVRQIYWEYLTIMASSLLGISGIRDVFNKGDK